MDQTGELCPRLVLAESVFLVVLANRHQKRSQGSWVGLARDANLRSKKRERDRETRDT